MNHAVLIGSPLSEEDVRERYYTVKEIAARLKVHPLTVRRWINAGALRGVRLAGQWRVTETDLQAFIDARRGEG